MGDTARRYAWWRAALQGNVGPTHADHPECGCFRMRIKMKMGHRWLPVAIYPDPETGEIKAIVGFDGSQQEARPEDVWIWCIKNVVTGDQYSKAFDSGRWHDDAPDARPSDSMEGISGDNAPTNPFDAIREELIGEQEAAKAMIGEPVSTKDKCDQLGVWARRVLAIRKRAEAERKAEKEPHLEAGRAVDAKWGPLIDMAQAIVESIKRRVEPFLIEQRRAAERAEREAHEEVVAKLKAAMEAEGRERAKLQVDADEAAKRMEDAAKQKKQAAGRTGQKIALRTYRLARIIDWQAAILALKDNAELRGLVQEIANRMAREGTKLAGAEIYTEERV